MPIEVWAKSEHAEIHWGDDTGLRSDSQNGGGDALKVGALVIGRNAKRS